MEDYTQEKLEESILNSETPFLEVPSIYSLRKEQCFCHFNGFKVKDSEARQKLDGKLGMGNIEVSSIKCKNMFNIDIWKGVKLNKNGLVNISENSLEIINYTGEDCYTTSGVTTTNNYVNEKNYKYLKFFLKKVLILIVNFLLFLIIVY